MKHILILSLVLTLSLLAFAGAPADDDAKAVQGTWLPTKAELGGQPMAEAVLKMIRLELNDGKYVAYVGDEPDKGTYTIDQASKPKGMTITGTEGPNQGKTFPAIYELGKDENGDTLRICYDLSGAKRPTEFKSTAGTKLYLVTYSRKKQ
jgi:uncharacterized protein (TIGR03067 family)